MNSQRLLIRDLNQSRGDGKACTFLFAVLSMLLSLPQVVHAQAGTSFVYPLTISPVEATYNEGLTANVLVRDNDTLAPLTGTVNFSVDGGAPIASTLNSVGVAYGYLGQLSIGNHTVTANYLGNAQDSPGSATQNVVVADANLSFVGTQGTTLFVDGTVSDVEGVAVDAQDNLYVADRPHNVVMKEDTLGNVTTLPLTGLSNPIGLALDSIGNLYIADTGNNRIVKFDTAGAQTVVPLTGLSTPTYIAYDRENDFLYVCDTGNNRIVEFTPATGSSTDVATALTMLRGVTVDSYGNVYFSDRNAGFVEITNGVQVPIFAAITEPGGIVADGGSNLYLSDVATNAVFQYDNSLISFYTGRQVQVNDSGNPTIGMATDNTGRVYLALGGRVDVLDVGAGRAPDVPVNVTGPSSNSLFNLIFQTPQAKPGFTVSAAPATAFNNVGAPSCPGGTGACFLQMYFTPQVAGVNKGSFSESDLGNTPLWGKGLGGGAVFTPGVSSQSTSGATTIGGVAIDFSGNRYVTDSEKNTVTEISASGTATPLAFTGLSGPTQVAVDGVGNVFVLDLGNQRIEVLSPNGQQTDAYILGGEENPLQSITAFNLDGEGNLFIAGSGGSPGVDLRKSSRSKAQSIPHKLTGKGLHPADSGDSNAIITYGSQSVIIVAEGLPTVTNLAVDPEENVFALDASGGLTRFGIDGSANALASGLANGAGLGLDASTTSYVLGSNSITTVHPDGSQVSIPIPGLTTGAALALDGYGDMLLGDSSNQQLLYLDRTQQNYGFGSVNVGKSAALDGSITNIGNQPFAISGPLPADSNFTQTSAANVCTAPGGTTAATSLAPTVSCDLGYTFAPQSSGQLSLSGTLATTPPTLNGSAGAGAIQMSGTGVGRAAVPQPVLTPAAIDFGSISVGTTSAIQTATLKNTGGATLTISSFGFFGANTSSFNQTNNCGTSLAAGASCSITISCTPASAGALSASLGANFPSPLAQESVALTCTGSAPAAPAARLTPSSLDFGLVTTGTTTASQTLTLSSTGTAPLAITSIAVTGANASSFAETTTCGSMLAAGSTCAIAVTFDPVAVGNFAAAVTVQFGGGVATLTSALSGTGVAPVTAPAAVLTPASIMFNGTDLGTTSAAQTLTLSNPGTAALSITSITVAGVNASDFSETNNCGASLAAGASCTIPVTFTPASAGNFTAAVTGQFAGVANVSSTLSGTGLTPAAPGAVLTPASLNFSGVAAGTTSSPQILTLSNPGTAALIITGIALGGANSHSFAESNNCGTNLTVGGSCSISVTFTPASAGITESATVTVQDDAVGSPQGATLNGTSPEAPPPTSVDFTIAAQTPSQTISANQQAQYTILLAPAQSDAPFNSAITLAASGLPSGASASFTPPAVTPGAAQVSTVMTVSLGDVAAGAKQPALVNNTPHGRVPAAFALAGLGILFSFRRVRRARRAFLGIAIALILAAGFSSLTGCSETRTGFATPVSTSTITVTGTSGTLQHATTVTLTVQ